MNKSYTRISDGLVVTAHPSNDMDKAGYSYSYLIGDLVYVNWMEKDNFEELYELEGDNDVVQKKD